MGMTLVEWLSRWTDSWVTVDYDKVPGCMVLTIAVLLLKDGILERAGMSRVISLKEWAAEYFHDYHAAVMTKQLDLWATSL